MTKLIAAVLVVAATVAGYGWWSGRLPGSAAAGATAANGHADAPPPTVTVAPVTTRDIDVFLDGLGTVAAYNTVTIRPRVDGQIVRIAFREGQDVKAGDLLAQIDPRPFQAQLAQAMANRQKDQAQLANARLDLERAIELERRGVGPRQATDTQRALVAQLEAAAAADQAMIDSAKVQLDYAQITAPIDGRIGIRQIDVGNIVHQADSAGLAVITQVQPISVLFSLPQDNLLAISDAMATGPLAVQAYSRDNRVELGSGTLALIDNQIDPQTGTIKLKATFANAGRRLWPGQFVNVRLHLATRPAVLVVPASAVQRGPQGPYVYLLKPDTRVEMRPVSTGPTEDGATVIEGGLAAGDRVVSEGQYKLQPGGRATVAAPS